jgi:glycosyltransferase involved in cell wall biosynthesis
MPQKGLGFLLDGCRAARRHGVDLQLVVMGDGPLAGWLTERTSEEPWIHAVGPQFGTEKARLLAAADVFAMPSGVGLSILDAFAAGLPVIAADLRNHNPEIAYLEHGRNGVMAPADPVAYGAQLAQLLTDERECKKMSLGARATAGRYTVDNMVNNFAAGIEVALGRGRQVRPVDTSVA